VGGDIVRVSTTKEGPVEVTVPLFMVSWDGEGLSGIVRVGGTVYVQMGSRKRGFAFEKQ